MAEKARQGRSIKIKPTILRKAHHRAIESEIVKVNAGIPTSGNAFTDFFIGAASMVPIGLGISEGVDLADENAKNDELLKSIYDDKPTFNFTGFKEEIKTPNLSLEDYWKNR